jgi:hypothetical protein
VLTRDSRKLRLLVNLAECCDKYQTIILKTGVNSRKLLIVYFFHLSQMESETKLSFSSVGRSELPLEVKREGSEAEHLIFL